MNIILIGMRGSGKTSVGKKLAGKLWMEFVDTDALIVERAGKTIRELFETEGEPAYRDRECEAVKQAMTRDNVVIAAGGGSVLRPENVEAFKKNGKIVWLKANAQTLHQRIAADPDSAATRPNLTAAGGLEEVSKVLEARTPVYEAAADVSLDVTYLNIEDAATRLATMI